MRGKGKFKMAKRMAMAPADMLGVGLHALPLQPVRNFSIANDQRPGPPRDRYRIAQMVSVTMRDQNKIRMDLFSADTGFWIPRKIRVHQNMKPAHFQTQSGVPQPG